MDFTFIGQFMAWISGFFKKPEEIHVYVPPATTGSPDWQQKDVNNASQNWEPYLSLPFRTQWAGGFDEDNCATRAAIVCLEAILNYYLTNNLFPDNLATFLKTYYCNKDGYVKLSIRFNSKLNNTTTKGANVTDVWNNFNRDGIVPENVYPDPDGKFTWNEYYQNVPYGIEQYGIMTTKMFEVLWQTIWNNRWSAPNIPVLRAALITSPVYFASCVGERDSKGIEIDPNAKVYQHARTLIAENPAYQSVLDSYAYPTFFHQLEPRFPLACAIKCAIKII